MSWCPRMSRTAHDCPLVNIHLKGIGHAMIKEYRLERTYIFHRTWKIQLKGTRYLETSLLQPDTMSYGLNDNHLAHPSPISPIIVRQ